MQIRTFTADNAKAAIAKVRAEMGPYAVIIAMDETAKGGGVIVRAALEPSAELRLEHFICTRIDAARHCSSLEAPARAA